MLQTRAMGESNHRRSLEAGVTASFLPKRLQIREQLNRLRSLLAVDVCQI
ncbi:MAG: hypothetical protein ACYT04_67235 [Nostoc sp.]